MPPTASNPSYSDVVKAYRIQRGLSLRAFAEALNEKLVNTGASYGAVKEWERPEAHWEPSLRLLFELIATYQDWRGAFARDCLAALYPDLVGRVIEIHPLATTLKPK
jgi:transcriptional regulator with XRE-family HTH domain